MEALNIKIRAITHCYCINRIWISIEKTKMKSKLTDSCPKYVKMQHFWTFTNTILWILLTVWLYFLSFEALIHGNIISNNDFGHWNNLQPHIFSPMCKIGGVLCRITAFYNTKFSRASKWPPCHKLVPLPLPHMQFFKKGSQFLVKWHLYAMYFHLKMLNTCLFVFKCA